MAERTATAEWNGNLMEGEGKVALGSGVFKGGFSFATRMGDEPGTNPEELLGASLAGCYAMALNATLEKQGTPATKVGTEAKVFLGKDDSGFKINCIDLYATASVPGMSSEDFAKVAEAVKESCPISRALSATNITLNTTLSEAKTAS